MVRELKKRNKDGVLYKRPEAIEYAIKVALQQDMERLHRRAWLTERQGGEFLPMECLVHLIRNAFRVRLCSSSLLYWNGPVLYVERLRQDSSTTSRPIFCSTQIQQRDH